MLFVGLRLPCGGDMSDIGVRGSPQDRSIGGTIAGASWSRYAASLETGVLERRRKTGWMSLPGTTRTSGFRRARFA
jgi:hypothetical protein